MTKKLFYLLFLLMPFIMGSCKDDKDEPSKNGIVGTWTCYDYDEGDLWKSTITFKDDDTFVWKWSGDYPSSDNGFMLGSYSYDSAAEILILTLKGDSEDGNWSKDEYETEYFECSIKGNKMILDVGEVQLIFTKS